jgi:bifunctional non-homologous end joining protein LigD
MGRISFGHPHAITRGGQDWTHRFPAIVKAAEQLHVDSAIMDGEAVVLDESGRPSFSAVQQALGGRGGKQNADAAVFYVFDLLYADGYDLRRMDLEERRAMLESTVPATGAIKLSEEVEATGRGCWRKRASSV